MKYNVVKARYRYAFWNDRAFVCLPSEMSVAELEAAVVSAFEDNAYIIESLWYKIDADETGTISLDTLKQRVTSGSYNSVWIWDVPSLSFLSGDTAAILKL